MPFRPHGAPITPSYRDALRVLATQGGTSVGERTFPLPRVYKLTKPNGFTYAADVPLVTVEALLADGYIVGSDETPGRADRVRYRVTDAGRQGWALEAPPVDPAQLGLFGAETPGAADARGHMDAGLFDRERAA